jgi:hypothetical protein
MICRRGACERNLVKVDRERNTGVSHSDLHTRKHRWVTGHIGSSSRLAEAVQNHDTVGIPVRDCAPTRTRIGTRRRLALYLNSLVSSKEPKLCACCNNIK